MVDVLKLLKKNCHSQFSKSVSYVYNLLEGDSLTAVDDTALPPSLFYVPNFISEDSEKQLLSCLYEASEGNTPRPWVALTSRRLQCYDTTDKTQPMPPYLLQLLDQLNNCRTIRDMLKHYQSCHSLTDINSSSNSIKDNSGYTDIAITCPLFNHVLINEYQPGQGISKCAMYI